MSGFYQSARWKAVRAQVVKRDGWTCAFCGWVSKDKRGLVVDHIQPLKERPDLAYRLSNLRTLCRTCDNRRHYDKRHGKRTVKAVGLDGYTEEWR